MYMAQRMQIDEDKSKCKDTYEKGIEGKIRVNVKSRIRGGAERLRNFKDT